MSDSPWRAGALALIAVFAAHLLTIQVIGADERSSRREGKAKERASAPLEREMTEPGARAIVDDLNSDGSKEGEGPNKGDKGDKGGRRSKGTVQVVARGDVSSYEGLGTWIDLFNRGPWKNPAHTVARMDRRGVSTIYLQTSTYGSDSAIVHPKHTGTFIDAAHERGLRVVGWSVPSFRWQKADLHRALAGIRFRSRSGEAFDSFALDIESTLVGDISVRNERLMRLTKRVRKQIGSGYPLGAITPDPVMASYWPNFPYRKVARRYDVIVPMGYFTFRTHGFQGIKNYTDVGIASIRRRIGNSDIPIHFIGGIADEVGVPAAKAFVRAVKRGKAIGASLYDFPITRPETWKTLRGIGSPSK